MLVLLIVIVVVVGVLVEPKVEKVYEVGLAEAKLVGTILNMAPLIASTYKNPSGPICKSVIPPKPHPNLNRESVQMLWLVINWLSIWI